MTYRSLFLLLGALVFLSGCVVAPEVYVEPEEEIAEVSEGFEDLLVSADESNDNVSITWDGDFIIFMTNSLPNHETGEFPNSGNPNTISAIDAEYSVSRNPIYVEEAQPSKLFGVTLGGVVFDPGTAEKDEASGWNIEALQDLYDLGLDFNNAHVQPSGKYHYHGIPTSLVEDASTLVAFAADGFPVFVDESMHSSYQLLEGERAEDEPSGNYDGTYTQDFEYVEGSGDLDDCNGAEVTNALYPEGSYAYFLTESFPYIPRCHHGTADSSFTQAEEGPPPGGGGALPSGPPTGAPPPRF